MSTRVFTLEVEKEATPFTFKINQRDFGKFLADAQRDANFASHNFLMNTVEGADKERLKKAFEEDWSLPLQMLAPLQDELVSQREVLVKKSVKPLPA